MMCRIPPAWLFIVVVILQEDKHINVNDAGLGPNMYWIHCAFVFRMNGRHGNQSNQRETQRFAVLSLFFFY